MAATVPVAANPAVDLDVRDRTLARQAGDSFAGSVHDSFPRLSAVSGVWLDARKRHKQENNKTDNNQGSRKKEEQ
ncbi:hypothetical protein MJ391_00570 [Escherichia coli]|nr:hypothetical protein MJ391_00570 [Escherichia coli]